MTIPHAWLLRLLRAQHVDPPAHLLSNPAAAGYWEGYNAALVHITRAVEKKAHRERRLAELAKREAAGGRAACEVTGP